jgi:hypothetical protein
VVGGADVVAHAASSATVQAASATRHPQRRLSRAADDDHSTRIEDIPRGSGMG